MITIRNKFIPLKGSKDMTIWPFLFLRMNTVMKDDDMNHEHIHGRQQREVAIVSAVIIATLCLTCNISWWWMLLSLGVYYAWYGIEYGIRRIICGDQDKAYRGIAFEAEAYSNEDNMDYLKHRIPFAFIKYMK